MDNPPANMTRAERASAARIAEARAKAEVEAETAARVEREQASAREARQREADAKRGVGGEPTPPDRAKMGARVLSQLDAALDDLGNADPKDRASILSLAAKLSGLLAEQRTEDIPFTFRGWTRAPMPVLPAGVVAPCPACGQALPTVPGGSV